MDNTPDKYVERLLELSKKKHEFLLQMLALTRRQTESMFEDGIEDLQKLIDEKQIRINEIDKIDENFNVYFQRLKQVVNVKDLDELKDSKIVGIKELKEIVSKVMQLINIIIEIEKQNSNKSKELLSHLGNEIKKLNQNKKMASAYMPEPGKPPSYFLDKKK